MPNAERPLSIALPADGHGNGHCTAKLAVRILVEKDLGFVEPSRKEREAMLVGFAMHQKVLYGAAFDVIRLSRPIDLLSPQAIADNMDAITVHEIKSTNRANVKADLKGYFFNITAAELLVAQSLGAQFRFAFVNTLTREHQEMALNDIFARSRAVYTFEKAQKALADGAADAIGFGRAFLANPDLPYRFAHGLPLADDDTATWYTQGREGFSDYPAARVGRPSH